ncbi:AraC family transcriptional regulator [Alkalihalobacillus sp. 1P02AB]|uniref:helix-turn-helix transcriptional regulator n=1 Tax=Alkalihalobacillus sp. 1P02AB TaxID=3132260 RepID=UPI0039A509EB
MSISLIDDHLQFGYHQNTKSKIDFHSHEKAEIYYFHGGKCNYLIGDEIHILSPGDLILMHGLTLHRPKIYEEDDYIRTTIHFDTSYFSQLLEPMGLERVLLPFTKLKSLRIHFEGKKKEELESYFIRIQQLKDNGDLLSVQRYQLLFIDLLAFIYPFCQNSLAKKRTHRSDKEKHVQRVITYIENHYHEEISMEFLEEHLHLSRFYLSKIFKEVTGVTIFTFLYQKRVNQAKIELMLYPNRTVTEVSFAMGFKHPSHLSKVFKQLTGMTPEQYRKEVVS